MDIKSAVKDLENTGESANSEEVEKSFVGGKED
jgi:hypothetical protein